MGEVELRRMLPVHLTWLAGAALTWLTWLDLSATRLGQDSHAYWAAWQGSMYANPPGSLDAYNYSPVFAELLWPVAQLPWPLFGALFFVASVVGLLHLLRPLGWRWTLPLMLCCTPELLSGNVFWVLALVAAYGLRQPVLWAFVLLTKITPGLGPVWFAVRGEWRALTVSVVATVAICATSLVFAPGLWGDWIHFLTHHAHGSAHTTGSDLFPPLAVRLPVALVVVAWAARTDRRWALPVAMVLATPVTGIAAFTVLTAVPRLVQTGLPSTATRVAPIAVGDRI